MARKTSTRRKKAPDSPDPTRLSIDQLCEVLQKAGAKEVTPDRIRADLAAGAPSQKDGSVHFVQYLAWLVQETKG